MIVRDSGGGLFARVTRSLPENATFWQQGEHAGENAKQALVGRAQLSPAPLFRRKDCPSRFREEREVNDDV
jgi:hypothetical protein